MINRMPNRTQNKLQNKMQNEGKIRTPYQKYRNRKYYWIGCICVGVLILLGLLGKGFYDEIRTRQIYREASQNLVPLGQLGGDGTFASEEAGAVAEDGLHNVDNNTDVENGSGGNSETGTGTENLSGDGSSQNAGLVTWGILEILKIDLDMIVSEGTDNTVLRYSLGHMEETSFPNATASNCVISGH